ncbi:SDR family oxidoreductase [Falsibacillus albus]|uniref:Glucose 1-dehydrogenase n=1 Tax=Falsibacillus albus TaxID=2478915 RepID=A0A3L7K6H2_9BACI|nr:SDR family oxidoreductase [Falsibacillus albus]RLQ96302.1 glucose 1-dehydrogenase [Falsibacillus albus]
MEGKEILEELFNLKDKVAIVTGGGRGLGKEMAIALAEAGAKVVVCSRNLPACEEVKTLLENSGTEALAVSCDIQLKEDIQKVIDLTLEKFNRIDILINNSGTSWTGPFTEIPEEKWDKVMDVNVKGTFLFSQEAAKIMMKQKSGKIINIASVSGFGGTPTVVMNTVPYNTSKGAVITFTKDLAVKLARHNIQVNAIAPGFFPTKITQELFKEQGDQLKYMIPSERFGQAEDLKGAAIFLASNASNYINGHVLVIDGGIRALV